MKFVLIAFIFISLHYASSQYDIYSHYYMPYNSYTRYIRAHPFSFKYPQTSQPTTVRYNAYRNFTPENGIVVVSKKQTEVDQMQSHLDNLLSRMKSTMEQMSKKQERSATDQSSMANPNSKFYKGKLTKKTLASFRSASV